MVLKGLINLLNSCY